MCIYVSDREIIIDSPPMPSGMLLNTPSQTRSKYVSTLPGKYPLLIFVNYSIFYRLSFETTILPAKLIEFSALE